MLDMVCTEMSDTISREAAVAALQNEIARYPDNTIRCNTNRDAIVLLRALPAAPAPQPTVPLKVKLALRVLLNHVEPGWDNCKTVVQLWLDAAPCGCAACVLPNICPDGDECPDAQFHTPAPQPEQPWTEQELAEAFYCGLQPRVGYPMASTLSVDMATVALSRPLPAQPTEGRVMADKIGTGGDLISREQAMAAVRSEEECDGPIPPELSGIDRTELVRAAVRATKHNIEAAIRALTSIAPDPIEAERGDKLYDELLTAREEIARLRAALRRCHTLLQDAGHWIDMDEHADWHEAMDKELLVCDEAGSCPAVKVEP